MRHLLSTTACICMLAYASVAFSHDADNAKGQMEGAPSYLENAISHLPAAKAQKFRDTMREEHEENEDIYKKIHQLQAEMRAILMTEKFDESAFLDKSSDLQTERDKIGANRAHAFGDAVADLSQSERITLVRSMTHQYGKRHSYLHKKSSAPQYTPSGTVKNQ